MAPYFPVTVCRSDGQFKTTTRAGVEELNQPTKEQLDDTPDANGNVDCYKKLSEEDPKAVDWRRKLGGMMMHLVGGKEHADRNYILSELPEGYVLWEHVKYNVKKVAEDSKKDKGKHAAGTFERQDSYLYGHPQGRKKRFRSPADFFHHLLWLSTDEEGDAMNCPCKICSPDPKKGDEAGVEETISEAPVKKDIKFVPTPPSASVSAPASSSKMPAPTQAPVPVTQQTQAKPPSQSLQVSVRSAERKADSDPNGKYLYRPGEVVWFNNGPNWRLGVIGRRGLLNDRPRYLIQPLSNPCQPQSPIIKDDENTLRPWLAWSVPDTTLPQIKNEIFDRVNWAILTSGQFDGRARDFIVDGSILAAKLIDASYSLFDQNKDALVGPGEVHYNGMFLGAEKIWVGEPVRLKTPSPPNTLPEQVVLIIHKMVEHTTPASKVVFTGDVYKFVEMPTPYKNRSQWPTPDLPPRMVADLRFRNEVADDAKRGIWYEWRLLEPAAKRGLNDIKGRWYETRKLLPILREPAKYHEDVTKGKLGDAGAWMNGRRDNNAVPEQRKKNRLDTLGQSVPPDFRVSRGLDGLPQDNEFPDQTSEGFVVADIDQFINLDQAHDFYGNDMQH